MDATKSLFNKKNPGYVGNSQTISAENAATKKKRADNKEPLNFEGTFDTKYVSSRELARDINTAFEALFSDFYGTVIRVVPSPNGGNALNCELYFRPSSDEVPGDAIKAFAAVDSQFNGGVQIKNLIHKATMKGRNEKSFVLTNMAAELLYDFMPDESKKQIKWDDPNSYDRFISIIEDRPQNTIGVVGAGTLYMCITVDLIQVLKFVYGEKQGKSGIIYAASPVTPVRAGYQMQGAVCNWILSITKMTWEQYHKIMNELGVNVNQSRLDVIVADKYKVQ